MFKNIQLFKLDDPSVVVPETLEDQLATRRFRPCGPLETMTLGWAPPLGESTSALLHVAGDCLLVCARRQERLLPAAVVTETVEERVLEMEDREARSVGRKERRQLRDQVLTEFLPRAFTRSRRVRAYVDRQAGWILVDVASRKAAEEVVELLRETLGSLPVHPPRPASPPETRMTQWVTEDQAPPGIELGDECELRNPRDDRSVVRCRGQDLAGEEISTHLRAGKQAVKLALEWQERLTCVLQEDLSIKRLRFAEELLDEAGEGAQEDEAARFDAEFLLMSHTLREFLRQLETLFELNRP